LVKIRRTWLSTVLTASFKLAAIAALLAPVAICSTISASRRDSGACNATRRGARSVAIAG
jgi:hypothetical protein